MKQSKLGVLGTAVLVVSALAVGATAASAQNTPRKRKLFRPLTVSQPVPPPPPAAPGLTAPIAGIGTLITAPLSGLNSAFGYGPFGGPAKPLPIVARYAGAGPVTDSKNEGWAQPVPVTANGPVYKLAETPNAGMVSPFELIAAPITAATTLAGAPLQAAGAVVGAAPAPAPVF